MMGASLALLNPQDLNACTRVVYKGFHDIIITGRSMDWRSELPTNLWIMPRGIKRDGRAGPNSMKWTSKFGSVIASGWDAGTSDGMNEKGLVVNMLYLSESEYPTVSADDKRKPMSISLWAQYFLDNFATVNEAVVAMQKEEFYIVTTQTLDGREGTIHLSLSDASGDSAIFEYVNGKLDIHHSKDYQVMTNSPIFDKQLALDEYWREIGGTVMLPGTNRAADRFVRASFYTEAVPKTDDVNKAVAITFSIVRNTSVPIGITTPNQPNISSTLWRSVADHKSKRYFFEFSHLPYVFWVSLNKIDFSEKASVKKLTLTGGNIYGGEVSEKFKNEKPFVFLEAIK